MNLIIDNWVGAPILGDNLFVMQQLPSDSIDLIYIDPPYFSGKNYTITIDGEKVCAFGDKWESMKEYLAWFNIRLYEMKRLLKPTGSICVHVDWHASHYIKVEMDIIFGYNNFVNEIIWRYRRWPSPAKSFQKMHNVIFWYSNARPSSRAWTQLYDPHSPASLLRWKGKKRVDKTSKKGTRYSDIGEEDSKGVAMSDVWEISQITAPFGEFTGYPTQKPEELLNRIIVATSNPNDIVADFFCGSGTTPTVAQRLNRRWIACDQSDIAITITANRLGLDYYYELDN